MFSHLLESALEGELESHLDADERKKEATARTVRPAKPYKLLSTLGD